MNRKSAEQKFNELVTYFSGSNGIIVDYREIEYTMHIDTLASINLDINDILFSFCHNLQYHFIYDNIAARDLFKIMLGKMYVPENSRLNTFKDDEDKVEYLLLPHQLTDTHSILVYIFKPKVPKLVDQEFVKSILDDFAEYAKQKIHSR